ncbi:hypothetical protein [Flavobacterium silvaticum]|uniref:Uncharacterized protein n=1 Tax=Flavobacterium silvaticum TaxID=1852020 RepID=A0A972FJH9_9FLAO|nr:hypothetical protein [Flavobacterium silvaticum]NMH26928.1 hypothetical protein [Flavobacterium silvaticum]
MINWTLIVAVVVAVVFLVAYIIWRNDKDRKKLEQDWSREEVYAEDIEGVSDDEKSRP